MTDDGTKTSRRSLLKATGTGIAASSGLAGVSAASGKKGKKKCRIPIKHYSPPDGKKKKKGKKESYKKCKKYKVLWLPPSAACAHLREHECDRVAFSKVEHEKLGRCLPKKCLKRVESR